MMAALSLSPFSFSLDSMLLSTRHEARRAPTTFLYATDSRLRSSTFSCTSSSARALTLVTMSS
jgi:hypothetical protein